MRKSSAEGFLGNLTFILVMVLLFVFYSARGGVDYDRYFDVTNQLTTSFYYMSNIVSWSIIYMARVLSNSLTEMSLIITYFLYLISVSSERPNSNTKSLYFLFLALISPVGVLLSLNVLRQYIALFFMFLAFYFWCKNKNYRAYIFLIISILSHQFVFLFVAIFFLHRTMKTYVVLLAIPVIVILINMYGPGFFSLGDDFEKLQVYIMYSSLLLAVHVVSLRLVSVDTFYNKLDVEKYLLVMFVTLLAFSYMTDLPVWGLNRLWIGYGFLLLLLIFSTKTIIFGKTWFLKVFVLVFNLVALSFHNGARGML
jgi:hypothetical protein